MTLRQLNKSYAMRRLTFRVALAVVVAIIVAAALVTSAHASWPIDASATREGIWVDTFSDMTCEASAQEVSPTGFTEWVVRPAWGSAVTVTCSFPETSGFVQITVRVEGQAFLPLICS